MTTATEHFDKAQESFDRCDTDGFLSQWAHQMNGIKAQEQARVDENGGMWRFLALFDADTEAIVPAKLISTRYGQAWALLESTDPRSAFTGQFVNPSEARKAETRRKNMVKKGYREGLVWAPAKADFVGGGSGLGGAANMQVGVVRTDAGFDADAEFAGWDDQDY